MMANEATPDGGTPGEIGGGWGMGGDRGMGGTVTLIGPAGGEAVDPSSLSGDALEVDEESWVWVDFPETFCADGSPTGLAINLKPGADRILVYFEGGGACWNYGNCSGILRTSLHLDGYDVTGFSSAYNLASFSNFAAMYLNSFVFDRDEPRNPFSDHHFVFIP